MILQVFREVLIPLPQRVNPNGFALFLSQNRLKQPKIAIFFGLQKYDKYFSETFERYSSNVVITLELSVTKKN